MSIRVNSWLNVLLGRSEADLDRRTWLLRVYDHGFVRWHIDELARLVSFSGCERKLLVFAHFEFLPAAPGVRKRRYGLRRGGDLSFHKRELCVILLMLEQQLGHILPRAILIALLLFDELYDLKVRAANGVADFQKLRRLALVDVVDAERIFGARCKNVPERFFRSGHQL